jgi:hypothetical protein
MALLQLQAILGRWIDLRPKHFWSSKPGSPYENPSRAFLEYVKAIADLPDRAELTQQLTSIGNLNYTSAVASIKRAINGGSLRTLLKQLELGFHQYSIAYIVARAVHSAGLESALRYTVTQAEEGFVCAHSGLIEPLSFVFDKPDDLPSYFIERLTAGVSDSELITAYSSPVFPLFTKSFVRVLVASGRTLGSGETFNRGLDDLKALESTYSQAPLAIDTPFENGWISLALLKAYKKQGNTVMAKAYATRVATMLVVEKSVRASA